MLTILDIGGFSFIFFYFFRLNLKRMEYYYKSLIDKDEIAKSFLRQRELIHNRTETEVNFILKLN